jgi:hypothetical protein
MRKCGAIFVAALGFLSLSRTAGAQIPTPTPPHLVLDQIYCGNDYNYAVLFNPANTAFNLGTSGYFLRTQKNPSLPSDDYAFTSCDVIPAQGYFMVATTHNAGGVMPDAVANLELIASSVAGYSWVMLTDPSGTVDTVGWSNMSVPPQFYEGTSNHRALSGELAFFRMTGTAGAMVHHLDTDNNNADFTRQTRVPVSSGQIPSSGEGSWFCHTLWPAFDEETQQWTKVCSFGVSYYYQAINEQYPPYAEPYLTAGYTEVTAAANYDAWFGISNFTQPTGIDCWDRVHLQLVAWGTQSSLSMQKETRLYLRSGSTYDYRNVTFLAQTSLVSTNPWSKDPATGLAWDENSLDNLRIGIKSDDVRTEINLTRFYALVWYTGFPPPPSPTPSPSTSPTPSPAPSPTETPTPNGYQTPTPVPSSTPSPTPSPTAVPPTPTPWRMVVDADDYDGNGTADLALWRGYNVSWRVRNVSIVYYGRPTDIPAPGDYNADGVADIALFRPSSGQWFLRGADGATAGDAYYGQNGDIPVPADYDGDFHTDTALWRPSTGWWYVRGMTRFVYGLNGDIPIPGDYDGDGTADPATYRYAPGYAVWFVRDLTRFFYGKPGDIPVPGDYSGSGLTQVAVFRPAYGRWYTRGEAYLTFGANGDIPFALDYDGNGTAERALYRPSEGNWYIYAVSIVAFGTQTDKPLAGKPY